MRADVLSCRGIAIGRHRDWGSTFAQPALLCGCGCDAQAYLWDIMHTNVHTNFPADKHLHNTEKPTLRTPLQQSWIFAPARKERHAKEYQKQRGSHPTLGCAKPFSGGSAARHRRAQGGHVLICNALTPYTARPARPRPCLGVGGTDQRTALITPCSSGTSDKRHARPARSQARPGARPRLWAAARAPNQCRAGSA